MFTTLLLALAVGPMIKPPIHRVWTTVLSDSTQVQAVRNGVIYYTSQLTAGALNIQTGKPIWSHKFGLWNMHGDVNKDTMFVVSTENKSTSLYAVNLKTGDPTKIATVPENIDGFACDDERVYVLSGSAGLAFDAKTGKSLWKKEYIDKKPSKRLLGSATTGFGRLFFGIEGPGLHCVDPKTGNVIWKVSPEYGSYDPPTLTANGVVTRFSDIQLLDYSKGKPKWTLKTSSSEVLAMIGNVLVTKDKAVLVGFNATTGDKMWSTKAPVDTASRRGGNRDQLPVDKEGAMINDEGFFHVTVGGKVDWTVKPTFDGSPVFADAAMMICNDGNRLLGYRSGDLEPLPADETKRKAKGFDLVASFESLDQGERNQVLKLAKYTTQPLIRKYVAWSKAYDRIEGGERSGQDMMLYDLLTSTAPMLDEMCTATDTTALVQSLAEMGPKGKYRDEIKKVLGHRGDPAQVMPIYVALLKLERGKIGWDSRDSASLDAVVHSTSPIAIQFMIDALDDPTSPNEWRHASFVHLAGVGGPKGIAAVLRAKMKPGARPTWQASMMQRFARGDEITQGKDAKGRTWRLLHSSILGNTSDLYMQEKKGASWAPAIFLNVYTGRTFGGKAPTEYRGIPMAKLIEAEWLKVFPDDASLRKDSDGDGLTDLVEARLGTDLNKADTDGDGLKDSVDPCPNAAPRALNDKEKIIAACVEAKFFSQGWEVPAIISVDGMNPFELVGYDSFLLWSVGRERGSLGSMYGAGMNSIGFGPPMNRLDDKVIGKEIIKIFADGKSAETTISRYSGGLNGEGQAVKLIKIANDWFVTEIETRYVS